ncbi:hypothetical protein JNK13_12000 [bacterium]|nr:hypothetical protein [bacterium]
MERQEVIEQAIKDISLIRQVLERTGDGNQTAGVFGEISAATNKLRCRILGLASILAFAFCILELVTNHSQTALLLLSKNNFIVQKIGVLQTAAGLFVLCCALFVMVEITAKKEEEDLDSYISRYFSYLRNLGLFSDLLVKFIIFSLFIFAGQAEWIAPLLLVFTGDYLFQGRLFIFPVRISIGLGIVCMLLAALQFYLADPQLWFPCAVFATIATSSLYWTLKHAGPVTTNA